MWLVKLFVNLGYGSCKDMQWVIKNGWVINWEGMVLKVDSKILYEDILFDDVLFDLV